MIEKTLTNEQKIKATLTPVTETGRPAKLDGAPSWTIQDGNCTISVADDGLSATIIAGDVPGDTMILIEADADLGAGVQKVSDAIKIHVEGAMAKSLGLAFGEPEPK